MAHFPGARRAMLFFGATLFVFGQATPDYNALPRQGKLKVIGFRVAVPPRWGERQSVDNFMTYRSPGRTISATS